MTNGLPSRTNVCTCRKRTCDPKEEVRVWISSDHRGAFAEFAEPGVTEYLAPSARSSDGTSIILTFHHAIMDALSGTRILHDVMRALAGEVLPPLPPVEEMIASFAPNPVVVGESGSRADISSKARTPAAQAPDRFKANLAIMEWNQKDTARLLRSCKANGTTVHGAICAAASRHLPASDADAVRMHCPIDLGRIMKIETTGCGVFIGAGIVEIPAVGQKLWDDARYIVDNLRMARSPAAAAGMLQWIAAEMPPTAARDSVAASFASLPQSSAVISRRRRWRTNSAGSIHEPKFFGSSASSRMHRRSGRAAGHHNSVVARRRRVGSR